MNTNRRLAALALSLAGMLSATHTADAQGQQVDHVVGVWRLVSFVEQRPNGELIPSGRYGPNVAGMIVYDKSGAMMAQLMNPDRPKFIAETATQGTPEEVKAAFDGYNAYYGTFTVDAASSTIRHNVTANLFPNAVGTVFVRRYRIANDTLLLELPPAQIQGERRIVRLVWKRVN